MSYAKLFQLVEANPAELLTRLQMVGAAVFAIVPFLIPQLGSSYLNSLVIISLFYITLTQSWNLISGYTGYLSFGHTLFLGTGAFAGAILLQSFGLHWVVTALLAGVIAVVLSLIVGVPTLRLKGVYFAIGMLILSEVGLLASEGPLSPLTNGVQGIIIATGPTRITLYYAFAVLALVSVATTFFLVNTRIGLYFRAIREQELAAEAIGVDTTRIKLFAFAVSAFFPGVAGALYAMYITYIDPGVVFALHFNLQMVFMTIIGGIGTVAGPVIGALVFGLFTEAFSISAPALVQSLTGLVLVLIVYFKPGGLYGIYQDYWDE